MALQGSIETFALADVLRLLASTSKTGRLRLSGTRGSGSLWVVDGKLVSGDVSTASTGGPTDVLFELLRFPDGDFSFDQDELAPEVGAPVEVEAALADAEAMLAEWQELEAVVPSLDAWVALRPTLAGDSITLDGAQWQAIVAVEGGRRVSDYAGATGLGELAVMRQVRDLVELGVAEVGDAPADAPTAPVAATATAEAPTADEPTADEGAMPEAPAAADETEGSDADAVGTDTTEASTDDGEAFESFDPDGLVVEDTWSVEQSSTDEASETDQDTADGGDEPEMDAADIARQLATLSPAAARAVAAAAKASTPEEREEALAGIPEEEGSLNRDLLLQFLGSVNS